MFNVDNKSEFSQRETTQDSIMHEGFIAASELKMQLADNPYPEGSQEYTFWKEGWESNKNDQGK
jgi:hypothetical protein